MDTLTDLFPTPLEIEIIKFDNQANADKEHYSVTFSDQTQEHFSCNSIDLPLELIIWSWRINQELPANHYVTFGLNFSSLNKGKIITDLLLNKMLESAKGLATKFNDYFDNPNLEIQFKTFLKSEIQRFFKEEKQDKLVLKETEDGKLKIYPNNDLTPNIIGVVLLIGIIWGAFSFLTSFNSSSRYSGSSSDFFTSKEYTDSVIERTGVGSTIDSEKEMIKVCMTMLQDRGMSYSEASQRCY